MEAPEIEELIEARRRGGSAYSELLRVSSMSWGIYAIPAGGTDPQSPHSEDEVYYVIQGRARIRVGREDRAVRTGSLIFVPVRVAHRFHGILEELAVLVFFGPAEGTKAR